MSYEEESKILDILTFKNESLFFDYTSNPDGWESKNIPDKIKNGLRGKG